MRRSLVPARVREVGVRDGDHGRFRPVATGARSNRVGVHGAGTFRVRPALRDGVSGLRPERQSPGPSGLVAIRSRASSLNTPIASRSQPVVVAGDRDQRRDRAEFGGGGLDRPPAGPFVAEHVAGVHDQVGLG